MKKLGLKMIIKTKERKIIIISLTLYENKKKKKIMIRNNLLGTSESSICNFLYIIE